MPEAQRNASRTGIGPLKEALLQRLPFDELENQGWSALSLDDVEERADVGMVDLRDETRLAFEARETVGIVGERRGKDLDGDVPSKASIARTIHLAHGAVTQQTDNLISPEPVAGLVTPSLGTIVPPIYSMLAAALALQVSGTPGSAPLVLR